MKLKLHGREPQCVHKTQKEADKGNGRCSRCTMPMAPLNQVRYWSPFMDNARFTVMVASPRNAEIIEAFLSAPHTTITHVLVAA
jgi:hypothetical protein